MRKPLRAVAAPIVAACAFAIAPSAHAVGESDAQGFPSWEERAFHQLANRARVDPQLEMQACGAPCAEAAATTRRCRRSGTTAT